MPIFVGRNPETNEEYQFEFDYTASIEDVKTQICDRLGVESKHYNLVYRDELILNRKSLQELDLAGDPNPHLYIARIHKSAKPINALSLLGLPGLGAAFNTEEESVENKRLPHPIPRYTEAGFLEDPTKFSVPRNSAFAYKIYATTKQMYTQGDNEKLMESVTTGIERIVDSLNYDELEQLATECLQINQKRMESLRDQYYSLYEGQT